MVTTQGIERLRNSTLKSPSFNTEPMDGKKEKRIRTRVSYKTFEQMAKVAKTGDVGAILTELHSILDKRHSYGSLKSAGYADESLELIKKDLKL